MIVIIDYGMGNLGSIENMFKKVGVKARISSDPVEIEKADKLVLPGVGAFDAGMKNLEARGIIPMLEYKVIKEKTPILGVCLGMQLLCQKSEEGKLPGLRWLDAEVVRFQFDRNRTNIRIPHMGWNTVTICRVHPLFTDYEVEQRFYFVHSYYVVCADQGNVLALSNYGLEFAAAIIKDNILGVQFHPEKSHKYGMRLFKNFAERV